jgi:hypothetical protein
VLLPVPFSAAKPYSRRRPPEALKALPRVGRSDRRQLNGITRLDHGVNKDAFLSCRFVAENATTDTPGPQLHPYAGWGPLIRVPDGGGCGDLQKRHNHAQLCPENP